MTVGNDILAGQNGESFEEGRDAMKEEIPVTEDLLSHRSHCLDWVIISPSLYPLPYHRTQHPRIHLLHRTVAALPYVVVFGSQAEN